MTEGQEVIMEDGKEIRMTPMQLEMLLEYLPEGVMLEISWGNADEKET